MVRFWFYFYFAWLKSEKRSIVTSAISWKPVTGGKLREVLRSHRQGQAESLTGALVKLGRAGPFFCSQTSLEIHVFGRQIWILRPLDISWSDWANNTMYHVHYTHLHTFFLTIYYIEVMSSIHFYKEHIKAFLPSQHISLIFGPQLVIIDPRLIIRMQTRNRFLSRIA